MNVVLMNELAVFAADTYVIDEVHGLAPAMGRVLVDLMPAEVL